MSRPVAVSSAYEILLAKQEQRDARPEYVLKNAALVPAKGDDAGSRKGPSSPLSSPASGVLSLRPGTSRRVHAADDEHSLIDEYEVE